MIKVSVKSKKTGNIRTLLVFKMCERSIIYDMKIKYEMKFVDLNFLLKKIESAVVEISNSESNKINIEGLDKCYILKTKVKTFDLGKHQILKTNETNWNTLYEKFFKGRNYGELDNSERSVFQEKVFEKKIMSEFFESTEWYCKDKTIQEFKKSIRRLKTFSDSQSAGINSEKPKFPNFWKPSHIKNANLSPQEVIDYRAYLISIGHTPVYSTQNKSKIIGYKKP